MSKILNHQASLELLRQHTGIPWRTINYSQLIPHMCAVSLRDINQLTIQDNLLYVPLKNPFITNGDKLLDIIHGAKRDLLAIMPTFSFNLTDSVPPIELPPRPFADGIITGSIKLIGSIKITFPHSILKNISVSSGNASTFSISASETVNKLLTSLKISDFKTAPKPSLSIGSSFLSGDVMSSSRLTINPDMSIIAESKQQHFDSTSPALDGCQFTSAMGYQFTGKITLSDETTSTSSPVENSSFSKLFDILHASNLIWIAFLVKSTNGPGLITINNYLNQRQELAPPPNFIPPPTLEVALL